MFSGIIEWKTHILAIDGGTFTVENIFSREEPLHIWQSISHDGACMTVTAIEGESYQFFAMIESFDRTNFWSKQVGDSFNVERCLKYGDRVDGHFVSGHIDGTGRIEIVEDLSDGSRLITCSYSPTHTDHLIEKWSIAINGTSLTIVDCSDTTFSISLIPLTQEITNLGELRIGDTVNLEYDMMAKYILKAQCNK